MTESMSERAPTIRTERLRMTPFTMDDAGAVFVYASRSEPRSGIGVSLPDVVQGSHVGLRRGRGEKPAPPLQVRVSECQKAP